MEKKNIIKNSTDRLSGLPDSVLHYILSFLDSKSIVRTSTLSKQWKYTWIQGSTLPLDSSTFRSEPSFETYICKVLSRRSPSNLHKLSLTDYQDFKQEDYNIFVDVLKYAFAHNVQHLEINLQKCCLCWEESDYSFSDLFALTISQHRSLKSLDLVFIIIDIGFRSSGFEMLKDLELHGCWFTSKRDQVFDFFSGLPCLENLLLDGVHSNDENDELKIFRVYGLQLRTLNISNNQLCRIAINAPNLKSFVFHNLYTIAEFTEMDLSSLDHADVLIDDDSVDDDELIEYAQYLINFFAGLGNVKSLVLHSTTLEILRCISQALKDEPSPFTRLETLTFDLNNGWRKDGNEDANEDEDEEDEEEDEEEVDDNNEDEDEDEDGKEVDFDSGDEDEDEDEEEVDDSDTEDDDSDAEIAEAMNYLTRGSNPVVMYE